MSTTMFMVSASQNNAFFSLMHLSHLSAPLDYCIFKHHCLLKQFLYLCCTLSAPQDKHTIQVAEQDIIP